EIARAERQKSLLSVAIVDLDHFKFVNDTRGHAAGDELLVDIAERWKSALRTVDLMARYGGDEFVLVLPDCMLEDADKVLKRLQTSATQGCSAGIASWRKGDTASTILARADKALYKAKQDGRGRIVNEIDDLVYNHKICYIMN
ncbi:GGDEF domain protein, partial [mine drainage metagenome]